MVIFGALSVAALIVCVIVGLSLLARGGFTWSRLRLIIGGGFGLPLTIRMDILDNNQDFAFLFFPALILLGANATFGMRATFKFLREGRA
jgi:hypothetical protein